jgi:PAS domain S-box-containing protein
MEDRKKSNEGDAQAARELTQREFCLQQAERLACMGSWSLRPDLAFDYWSPEMFVCLGLNPSKGIPTFTEMLSAVHPDDRDVFVAAARKMVAGEGNLEITYRIIHPERGLRIMRNMGEVLFEDGKIARCVGNTADVTEQEQLIRELQHREDVTVRCNAYLGQAQALSHTGCFGWNISTGDLYWSEETFRILGYKPTITPKLDLVFKRVHPDDLLFVQQKVEQARQAEQMDFEHRLLMPDGSVKYVHVIARPFKTKTGDVEFVGSVMDITGRQKAIEDRKRAEESIAQKTRELERSERLLAEGQRLGQTGSFCWRVATDEITWSDELYRIYEVEVGVPVTMELIRSRVHPEDVSLIEKMKMFHQARNSGKDFDWQYRLLMPDHSIKYMHAVARVTQDPNGQLEYIAAVQDVTARHTAEESIADKTRELERSEFYLREGERLARMGSWSLMRDRTFDYWSPETFVLFDLDPSLGMPTFAQWVELLVPNDRERLTSLVDKMFSDGVRGDIKYWIDHRKQGRRMMHSVGEPVLEDSKVARLIGNTLDITEQQRAFEEIKALRDELHRENIVLREELGKTSMFEEVIGTSPILQMVLARAAKVAPTDSTVLIMGETGTGKELIARAIHKRSKRSEHPFISVNCAAVPSSLITSELFGHEKGAFTGAVQRRQGRFELAEGGTLFLDEVGDLPAETQIALLRVLQEREFERVGGTEILRADVRVIAATNRDLQRAIAESAFRSDLYYRLNVFPIELPPLRERKEDVPPLVNHFVDRYAKRAGKKIKHIQKKTLEMLQEYSWPGNVRELQNVIERSLIIAETSEFSVDKSWIANEPQSSTARTARKSDERERIESALAQSNGKISGANGAATKLGMPPSTLESKIRSLRINKFQFKRI